ncbi:hypothetical protein H181DRAFT_05665, partial [Streptomyces sp. WMMB 714]
GLTERLDAVDGLLLIDSPTGGPTTITAELPWREREGFTAESGGRGFSKGRQRPPGDARRGAGVG